MSSIHSVIVPVPDVASAEAFYATAFGLAGQVGFRAADRPTTDFEGFALSLVVAQTSTVDSLFATAVGAGATALKPAKKGLWGYGGVLRAPDGAIWKLASQSKKEVGPPTRTIDDIVLLLGVADVKASKRFYADHGFESRKSYGGRYADFVAGSSSITLALYGRAALAKDVGVSADGERRSPAIAVVGDAGRFTDPDGFVWQTASPPLVSSSDPASEEAAAGHWETRTDVS